MIRTSLFALTTGLALAAVHAPALAAEAVPFSRAAFERAQAEGRTIIVHVHADWCHVCRAQAPNIERATGSDVVVFRLDWDDQRSEAQRFNATTQSTVIAFRGRRETGRIAGDSTPSAISALVRTAAN